MIKVNKEDVKKDANALKIHVNEDELEYFVEQINDFMSFEHNVNLDNVEPLSYVNPEVFNVFSAGDENLIPVEDLMKNVHDREGNYIKVPKVIK